MTAPDLRRVLPGIVRWLRDALRPASIHPFGSCAYGAPACDSDIELTIVAPDWPLDCFERGVAASRALRPIGVPIDGLPYTRQEFDARAALPVSLERTVHTKGLALYAA
jgi:predicted nucleotidyltransferase